MAMEWVWEKFNEIGSHFLTFGRHRMELGLGCWRGGQHRTVRQGRNARAATYSPVSFTTSLWCFKIWVTIWRLSFQATGRGRPRWGRWAAGWPTCYGQAFMGLLGVVSGILPGNIANYISKADASNSPEGRAIFGGVDRLSGFGRRWPAIFRSQCL